MNDKIQNKDKLIEYWIEASDDDFDTMMAMFESRRFQWSLFVGHLMIEKLLKALYVKVHSDFPPYIHNLFRLAEKSRLKLTEQQTEQLLTITAFNINTRYDDYKMSFKQICTPDFTEHWIEIIINLRKWIKELIVQ